MKTRSIAELTALVMILQDKLNRLSSRITELEARKPIVENTREIRYGPIVRDEGWKDGDNGFATAVAKWIVPPITCTVVPPKDVKGTVPLLKSSKLDPSAQWPFPVMK